MEHNTFYLSKYTRQKKYKILRVVELVCCIPCFALAVVIFMIRIYFITKMLLMVVSTMFLFITLVDVICWLQSRPMGHRTWIVFSVTAFQMFCLCGGFLVFLKRDTNKILLHVTCGLYFLTGYVYIIDCVLVIIQYYKRDVKVAPMKEQMDRAVSACFMDLEDEEYMYKRTTIPRFRTTIRTKSHVTPTFSYGGTFAVSKDIAPLPTPDPLRKYSPPSPRKRMYSTLVDSYPEIGSGDFSGKLHTSGEIQRKELVLNSIYSPKSSINYQGRSETPQHRKRFSNNLPEPLFMNMLPFRNYVGK